MDTSRRATSDEGMRARLALALILLIAGCLTALIFYDVPQENRELLNVVMGALVAKLTDVYGYSFGSSAGRDRQADTLHEVAATARAAQAASAPSEPAIPVEPGQRVTVEGQDA